MTARSPHNPGRIRFSVGVAARKCTHTANRDSPCSGLHIGGAVAVIDYGGNEKPLTSCLALIG
jgi:hypothetical protein